MNEAGPYVFYDNSGVHRRKPGKDASPQKAFHKGYTSVSFSFQEDKYKVLFIHL